MDIVLSNAEEEKISGLIRDFFKKQSFSVIDDIIDYVSYRVKANPNINRNMIIQVIKTHIKNKTIIPGFKLIKENVLELKIRKRMFEFIGKNPGANVNDIKGVLNLGSNQALWHLNCLEKFEFIRVVKFGNQKAFFRFDLDSSYESRFFYLRKDKVKQIISLLENEDSSLRPTAIAEKLNTNYSTTNKYLKVLADLKILTMVNGNEKKSYILNINNYKKTLSELEKYK